MTISFKNYWIAGAFFIFSWILFLLFIQMPDRKNMEETHYVPSALQILAQERNQNYEHPPLAKELISIGIATWGDNPVGWRFMSSLFGSLTLVGVYFFALILFKNNEAAIWTSSLTLFNHLLYVMARNAMLDTFMMAFLMWAMVFFLLSMQRSSSSQRYYPFYCGIFFGLATACKWFALVPWAVCSALFLWDELKRPKSNLIGWITAFIMTPLIVYFLTYIPFFLNPQSDIQIENFWSAQWRMWIAQQQVIQVHPYMSQWYEWPFLQRPYWLAFYAEGTQNEWNRGVFLIGNPLIMWSGVFAVLFCAWKWITKKSKIAYWICLFYIIYLGCWIVIPRKISFYYYYYPAGIILSFALAYVFYFTKAFVWRWLYLLSAAGMFIYFFPILSGMKIPARTFYQWTWFKSWI